MPLRETLANSWDHIQGFLLLREEAGPLTAQHERFVIVLEVARIEAFVQGWQGLPGRSPKDRHALARACAATSASARFPAKAPFHGASPSLQTAACRPGFTRR